MRNGSFRLTDMPFTICIRLKSMYEIHIWRTVSSRNAASKAILQSCSTAFFMLWIIEVYSDMKVTIIASTTSRKLVIIQLRLFQMNPPSM